MFNILYGIVPVLIILFVFLHLYLIKLTCDKNVITEKKQLYQKARFVAALALCILMLVEAILGIILHEPLWLNALCIFISVTWFTHCILTLVASYISNRREKVMQDIEKDE